jgi:hypothetical protein
MPKSASVRERYNEAVVGVPYTPCEKRATDDSVAFAREFEEQLYRRAVD